MLNICSRAIFESRFAEVISMMDVPMTLTRRSLLAIFAAGAVAPDFSSAAEASTVLVHKDPNCGCCEGWIRHLRSSGFTVSVEETADLQSLRTRLGVPADLGACHTAKIAGYVIEGHVPAAAIRRLLETRPTAVGLAVPGMPAGSPGGGRKAAEVRGGALWNSWTADLSAVSWDRNRSLSRCINEK
ncbi:DUF411 domain-containing protein [Tardiphaga robiniae]|uniref:DUF411 domain-containing protein n=1 Tax=Tardiphaga robiniae TaxID=943830 RepID=UPI000AEA02A0